MSETSKKTYEVVVPFAGSITVVVETDADPSERVGLLQNSRFEQEVIAEAWKLKDPLSANNYAEYDFLAKISEGNILHAEVNEIEVIEVIDE